MIYCQIVRTYSSFRYHTVKSATNMNFPAIQLSKEIPYKILQRTSSTHTNRIDFRYHSDTISDKNYGTEYTVRKKENEKVWKIDSKLLLLVVGRWCWDKNVSELKDWEWECYVFYSVLGNICSSQFDLFDIYGVPNWTDDNANKIQNVFNSISSFVLQ